MLFEKLVKKRYRNALFRRADPTDDLKYFSVEDFSGLVRKEYKFSSRHGHKLAGQFYYYPDPIRDRIIVFDHGMGNGGHRSYMREIEMLARAGYKVFAYDHTGCAESGGESLRGLAQSLVDLDDCLNALKSDPEYSECTFSAIGHSWGAYSTLNILALHPNIAHIVAISGFLSVKDMHKQIFHGYLSLYRKNAYDMEEESNPSHVHFDAISALNKTKSRVLIIASDNDKIVKTALHHKKLEKKLIGKSNIRFLIVSGIDHNPNYTLDAVKYKRKFSKRLSKMRKSGLLETPEQKKAFIDEVDWLKMTEQDELVWQEIFETLKK